MQFKVLSGKNILLGITGSIAAYKSAFLTRLFVKAGANVKVVMTPAANDFITPLTLSTLSKNPVYSEFVCSSGWNNHIELARWADLMLIAPATASTIAKMANGICDNLLLAVYLAHPPTTSLREGEKHAQTPSLREGRDGLGVFIAPAMDADMYSHPTTKENLKKLRSFGNIIIPPAQGELASGLIGEGRMAEPQEILDFICEHLKKKSPLSGKKALVTAGPTYEPIDAVRFIANHSSGKMGFAIAEELAGAGAEVTLVCGPNSLSAKNNSIKRINVTTAGEMHNRCIKHFLQSDITVMAAAVADFKPKVKANAKVKKEEQDFDSIELIPTRDILTELGKRKNKKQILAGFALETENGIQNAQKKLHNKNLDFIVLNSPSDTTGFTHDTNKITIISPSPSLPKWKRAKKNTTVKEFELMSKTECAKEIVKAIISRIK